MKSKEPGKVKERKGKEKSASQRNGLVREG
jgi:hypothetical protein